MKRTLADTDILAPSPTDSELSAAMDAALELFDEDQVRDVICRVTESGFSSAEKIEILYGSSGDLFPCLSEAVMKCEVEKAKIYINAVLDPSNGLTSEQRVTLLMSLDMYEHSVLHNAICLSRNSEIVKLFVESVLGASDDSISFDEKISLINLRKAIPESSPHAVDVVKVYTDTVLSNPIFSTMDHAKLGKLLSSLRGFKIKNKSILTYLSSGDSNVNTNCKFKDVDGSDIACRQLAWEFLFRHKRQAAQGYQHFFVSRQLMHNCERLKNNVLDKSDILDRADRYIFTAVDRLGEGLHAVCCSLAVGEESLMLAGTDLHILAVVIMRKAEDVYVLKIYDPNETLVHHRSVFSSAEGILAVSLPDYISLENISSYCPLTENIMLCVFHNIASPRPKDKPVLVEPDRVFSYLTKGFLAEASYYGCSSSVAKGYQAIIDCPFIDTATKVERLKGLNNTYTPVLYLAMSCHNIALIQTIITAILESGNKLTDEARFTLLDSKKEKPVAPGSVSDKISGLYHAFYVGATRSMATYIQTILQKDSPIPIEEIMCLIRCADRCERPGVKAALMRGHIATVEKFIEIILLTTDDILNPDLKIQLIEPVLSYGAVVVKNACKTDALADAYTHVIDHATCFTDAQREAYALSDSQISALGVTYGKGAP
ncbi:MAG: ShET2/EspL2 family type III secretion system effector toxin [Coxiellaceae bacterium]|nr:ShET2/EspL2 family type III secretion system effector toxin [Coxiellaceae bacterium]